MGHYRQSFIKVPYVTAQQLQQLTAIIASEANEIDTITSTGEGKQRLIELHRATRDDDCSFTVVLLILVEYGSPDQRAPGKPTLVSRSVVSKLFDALEIFPEARPARGPIG